MKLFEDKATENQIFDHISFGIVPVGEKRELTIWVLNDASPKVTGHLQKLYFNVTCLDPETGVVITEEQIYVLDAPDQMRPKELAPLTLSWTPNVTLEQGLKAKLTISGQKILG